MRQCRCGGEPREQVTAVNDATYWHWQCPACGLATGWKESRAEASQAWEGENVWRDYWQFWVKDRVAHLPEQEPYGELLTLVDGRELFRMPEGKMETACHLAAEGESWSIVMWLPEYFLSPKEGESYYRACAQCQQELERRLPKWEQTYT